MYTYYDVVRGTVREAQKIECHEASEFLRDRKIKVKVMFELPRS